MFSLLWCLVYVGVVSVSGAWPYDHVIVDTMDGPVQGDVLNLHTGDKINTFLGIPYAEPPVGSLRWQVSHSLCVTSSLHNEQLKI